eukprot:6003505-Pyramimonas_sp.AAC.1
MAGQSHESTKQVLKAVILISGSISSALNTGEQLSNGAAWPGSCGKVHSKNALNVSASRTVLIIRLAALMHSLRFTASGSAPSIWIKYRTAFANSSSPSWTPADHFGLVPFSRNHLEAWWRKLPKFPFTISVSQSKFSMCLYGPDLPLESPPAVLTTPSAVEAARDAASSKVSSSGPPGEASLSPDPGLFKEKRLFFATGAAASDLPPKSDDGT